MTATDVLPAPGDTARGFRAGVAVVAVAHVILWTIVMVGGWLYWDDFILQGQAARLGLSTDLLLNNHDGHVMPATYAVVWVIQALAGLSYPLVAATMLIADLLLVVAAVAAFTTLLGRGPQTVAALAVFLLSPIMAPGLTWWSASLTLVPLMTCALFATVSHVRYLRTGSRAALITTVALVAVALCFFEKSVLIPGWLFLVTVLVEPTTGFGASAVRSLRWRWRLWAGWAVLLAGYFFAFAQLAEGRTNLPTGPGQVVELVTRAVFRTIAPGIVGGPLTWTPVDFSASSADPPAWLVLLGAGVLLAAVVAGCRRAGAARKAWIAAAIYLCVDLATFAIGRLGPNGDPAVVQAGRYVATALIPVSIAIGATVAAHGERLRRPSAHWPVVAALAAAGLFTLISWLGYAAIWSNNPAQTWVGNARVDLADADPQSPLLDQDVPDFILLPVTHPYNRTSWFLAPLRDQPGIAESTDRLQIIDNRGHLVPAAVQGVESLPATDGCYPVAPGGEVTIPLRNDLIAWAHTVAVDYRAQSPGLVSVAIGSGEPVTAEVIAGARQVFVRAEGGESTVTVASADAEVCVEAVEVGAVTPSQLPYGGSQDLTDELQGLGTTARGS